MRVEVMLRRIGGHSADQSEIGVELGHPAGRSPAWDPICVTRNPPPFSGRKSSVMFESVPLVENRNLAAAA